MFWGADSWFIKDRAAVLPRKSEIKGQTLIIRNRITIQDASPLEIALNPNGSMRLDKDGDISFDNDPRKFPNLLKA